MKKTVKILALLMALMMAVACFVACDKKEDKEDKDDKEKTETTDKSKDDKKEETSKEDDEKAVEEVIESYSDAATKKVDDGDEYLKNVEKYLDEDGSEYENAEETADEIAGIGVDIWNAANKRKEIEISKIEIDGDKATAEVEFTNIDQDSFNTIYNEKINELLQAFLMSDDCEYTYDGQPYMSVSNFYNDIDEELRNELTQQFNTMYAEQIDAAYVDAIKEADTKTENTTVTLKKIDGEWLISKIK